VAELGSRIRELRSQRDMTLKELSAKAAVSVSHLSEIERARTQPTADKLARIAASLGVSVTAITGGIEEASDNQMPAGLEELQADPTLGAGLDDEWVRLLSAISLDGRRPRSKSDFLTLYVLLRLYFRGLSHR